MGGFTQNLAMALVGASLLIVGAYWFHAKSIRVDRNLSRSPYELATLLEPWALKQLSLADANLEWQTCQKYGLANWPVLVDRESRAVRFQLGSDVFLEFWQNESEQPNDLMLEGVGRAIPKRTNLVKAKWYLVQYDLLIGEIKGDGGGTEVVSEKLPGEPE